jgi:hypothetical protein
MKIFTTSINIRASSETVWSILTDGERYPEWEPGTISFEGRVAPGERLEIHTTLAPHRTFRPTVTEVEPNRRMVWRSGMPLGLFEGERSFELQPLGNGQVQFYMREAFRGLLMPLIGRSIPDMHMPFAAFGAALKKRAEAMDASA